jgi:hypothetical protein
VFSRFESACRAKRGPDGWWGCDADRRVIRVIRGWRLVSVIRGCDLIRVNPWLGIDPRDPWLSRPLGDRPSR